VRPLKWLLVASLERLCTLIDLIPWRLEGYWYRHACLGCHPLRLADRSSKLEDRWKTGYWKIMQP
jgi:uncharacterized ParB-like nuclease family protein